MLVLKRDEIEIKRNLKYLDVEIVKTIWDEWDFEIFSNRCKWLEPLVICRCIDPMANINIKEWYEKTWLSLRKDSKINDLAKDDVYRGLDNLNSFEKRIQDYIYKKACETNKDSSIMYYDLTSSYFEGATCLISRNGYSRDHRPDLRQIELALLVTKEGIPYYWKVLKGNTQDVTTIEEMIMEMKKRFGLKDCLFVFDRGMSSKSNLGCIEDAGYHYITGLDIDEIRKLDAKTKVIPEYMEEMEYDIELYMKEYEMINENDTLFTREMIIDGQRCVISFDVSRFMADRKNRVNAIEKVTSWIIEKNEELVKAKKERSRDKLERDLKSKIKNKGLTTIFKYSIEEIIDRTKKKPMTRYRINYEIDEEKKREQGRLDGIGCFTANIAKEALPSSELIELYREKNKVEEAFEHMKSDIELRPIHLTREERVVAHVTICVLAYLIMNDLELKLKEKELKISAKKFLDKMSTCYYNEIQIKNYRDTIKKITLLNDEQKSMLKQLELAYLVDQKYAENLL